MSKNYNKYFNGNQNFNNVEPEESTKIVEPEVVEEDTRDEGVDVPQIFYGINNCKKLNVRTEPNKDADVVCVLDVTSTFEIEELESNPEWVKVTGDNGTEGFVGYCMKQYVAIK